jgi:hypothetical protein
MSDLPGRALGIGMMCIAGGTSWSAHAGMDVV